MRYRKLLLILFLPVVLYSVDDYKKDWTYFRTLNFNTKSTGANTTSDVYNFPVLIRLSASNMDFANADGNGADIRFANVNGTHYNYEIEAWDSTNQNAAIWVLVDTIHGNDSLDYMLMYYNNASAVDSSDNEVVFDTANGFAGVWHLNGDSLDATPLNNDATYSLNTSYVTGIIAQADTFNGANSDIGLELVANDIDTVCGMLSGWFKIDTADYADGGWEAFLEIADTVWDGNALGLRMSGSNYTRLATARNGSYTNSTTFNMADSNDTWQYMAGRWGPAADSIHFAIGRYHVSSKSVSTIPAQDTLNNCRAATRCERFKGYYFTGVADELRIDDAYRSRDWINLCYETQRESPTLITYSAEQLTKKPLYDYYYRNMKE